MKVLQIANDYLNTQLYQKLFAALLEGNIESQVYVPVDYRHICSDEELKAEGTVTVVPCFSTVERVLFYSKQRKLIREANKRWDLQKFNLLHAHTVFSGGYTAWKLHQQYHIPYVVAVRNTDKNVFFRYMLHLRHIGVKIMRDAAAVIFLSPAYRDSVIETYVPRSMRKEIYGKSLVVPNGISDIFIGDRCRPHNLSTEKIRLIYVGEISDNKNITTTVEAVEQLRQQGLPLTLTVAGPIRQAKYQGYFEHYPFITYLGKIAPKQVKEQMRQSDIFIMPSHAETFGLVYAEAMSQGLPVIYTRGQGFDGQFPDGTVGYAVNDRDAGDVAQKIRMVMEQYDTLARNAYEGSAKFSWDRIASEYQRIYTEVCQCGNK